MAGVVFSAGVLGAGLRGEKTTTLVDKTGSVPDPVAGDKNRMIRASAGLLSISNSPACSG